ncbi:MAG: tyrosine-type recombinase/integrase [Candidatus Methanoperedens sp.]|nr:tyrosine-type recombinase/integrase [Candidatus Methanoperedens sp.]
MDYIRDFVADCQARGLTAHTIETYRSCLKDFLEYHPDAAAVGLEELRAYLGELRIRNLAGSSLKGYFASLSAFYEFQVFSGCMAVNPVISFRRRYLRIKEQQNGENTRQLLSVQQVQLLLGAAAGLREKALILTLAKTGMRRGELLSLRVQDIIIKDGIVRIAPKAKRSNRLTFMDEELRDILVAYLSWRERRAKTSWLWISDHGGRIHKDVPNRILAGLGISLGLHQKEGPISERLTCHCMRHWFTTHLFRAGMNVEYLKWLRGDALKKEAWQIYNHIDIEEVRQEYLRRIPKLISFDEKLARYL